MTATDERGQRVQGEAIETEPKHRVVVGLLLTAGVAVALGAAMLGLPRGRQQLSEVARYAMQSSLPSWHLTEPVNEVVYGSRGFDTFGETFLLLAAVVSVVLLSRPREPRSGYFGEDIAGRREQAEIDPAEAPDSGEREARRAESAESDEESESSDDPDSDADTSAAQKKVAVEHRPKTPDNELVGGRGPEQAEAMSIIIRGAALIILTEAFGLFLKGSFSANWLPLTPPQTIRSGGIVQLFSGGELVEVGTGLIIAVFALLAMSHDWARDKSEDEPDNAEGSDAIANENEPAAQSANAAGGEDQ